MNWSTRLRRWVRIRTPPVRGRLDEADRGDRLAGAGRVLEPEAALGAGVLGRLLDDLLVLVGGLLPPSPAAPRRGPAPRPRPRARPRRWLVAPSALAPSRRRLRRRPRPPSRRCRSAVAVGAATCCSAISSARVPGERVDLVRVQFGAVAQLRRFVGEQALQPEQQREVAAPLDRGVLGARRRARLQRGVERAAPRGPGRQRLRPLAVEQEGLAGERRRPLDVGA